MSDQARHQYEGASLWDKAISAVSSPFVPKATLHHSARHSRKQGSHMDGQSPAVDAAVDAFAGDVSEHDADWMLLSKAGATRSKL